ncbi:MAG: hypothetical protein JWP97_6337 [Labilithrix sp.]|nr:hypothetical protein [Labilithrix sp.]
MSLSSENMMTLMAYADGELEGEGRRDAELLLAMNPDAVRFVEQVAGLGDLVSEGHDDRHGKTVAAFDVADAVMGKIAEDAAPKVSSIASIASARQARSARSGTGLKLGAGVVAALALAASIFVFAKHKNEEVPMAARPVSTTQQVAANGAAQQADESGPGVAIDSTSESVRVFYLPTANELSTSAVIWVDEQGEK